MTRAQLRELGLSDAAVDHRLRRGRLHRVHSGVFALGRPELSERGRWMAAVLCCGPGATLSHSSAAALWGIARVRAGEVHVSIPRSGDRRPPHIVVHRRALPADEVRVRDGILVTSPALTLVDLATLASATTLEAAVNEADRRDLIDPETLRGAIEHRQGRAGVPALRGLLDRQSFRLTDSELERRFLRLVREAGLPMPQTGETVNGYSVDFFWPELALIVETDGLRYHRTPIQQTRDRRRDQVHAAAGLTTLRFTHTQVRFEAGEVVATLAEVIRRSQRAA